MMADTNSSCASADLTEGVRRELDLTYTVLDPELVLARAELRAAKISFQQINALYPADFVQLPQLFASLVGEVEQALTFVNEIERHGLGLFYELVRTEMLDALWKIAPMDFSPAAVRPLLLITPQEFDAASSRLPVALICLRDAFWLGDNWVQLPELHEFEVLFIQTLKAHRDALLALDLHSTSALS